MKISEFIKCLEEVKEKHGDLPVNVFDSDDDNESEVEACVVEQCDENGVRIGVTVVDPETALSFQD